MRSLPAWRFAVALALALVIVTAVMAACGGTPTATPVPPTATPVPPTAAATATRLPPTATPVPPTATTVPPTATVAPPTATKAAAAGNATSAERELVAAAFTSMAKATSFGMKLTLEGAGAAALPGDIVIEVMLTPLRSVSLKLSEQVEMVVVGQDVFMKMGNTPWQKSAVEPAQFQQLQDSLNFASAVKPEDLATIEINKVGSEKIEGADSDAFTIVLPGAQPQPTKVWISKAARTIVKQIINVDGSQATVLFYGWNTVKVEAPKIP